MKMLYFCFSCAAIAFTGCSDNKNHLLPTGYFVATKGCDEGEVDVIRIAKEGEVYRARLQRYICDNAESFTLDYGEFKGAAPVGFTPQPTPKEGVELSGFVPPKSPESHFGLHNPGELNFAFEANGKSIRKFPSNRDREEFAYLKTDEGKRLPKEIQQAVLTENLTEGFIKYVKFAEESDSVQVKRYDLHHWFSKKNTGP